MVIKIKTQKIGKLRIYLKSGETVQSEKFLRKLFAKNKYRKILDEAKKSGIRNAHIYNTHAAYESGGDVTHYNVETANSGLTICLELVDEKNKLEIFFTTHKAIFKDKTVIFTEVELWSIDD